MKIVVVVERPLQPLDHDYPLQSALNEAFCSRADSSNSIVVVSIGSNQSKKQLEMAIESGADKGIHIVTQDSLNAYTVAEFMTNVVKYEKPDLIIISDQLTNEQCQTGKTLASMLNESFPLERCALNRKQYRLLVIREMLSGAHTVLLPMSVHSSKHNPWDSLSSYQEYSPFQSAALSA